MLGFELVSVRIFAVFENRIACVKIEFLLSGAKSADLVYISHELFGSLCFAGVISRSLYAARKRTVMVKTDDVVSLPAVERNRDIF